MNTRVGENNREVEEYIWEYYWTGQEVTRIGLAQMSKNTQENNTGEGKKCLGLI